jgi:hypothetical protein
MARIPTNARLFGEYLLGKKSPITEQDFTPEELSEMLRMIEQQDQANAAEEARLATKVDWAKKEAQQPFDENKNLILDKKTGVLVPRYSEEEYNKLMQDNLKSIQKDLKSYTETKDKTSVSYRDERKDSLGLDFVNAISESFKSPAYNIETSLGHFNAHKNKDGTVTIKDRYDFLGYGRDNSVKVPLSYFLGNLHLAITKPEAFGTILARTFLADRGRDVNITLDSKAKTAKTFKEAL